MAAKDMTDEQAYLSNVRKAMTNLALAERNVADRVADAVDGGVPIARVARAASLSRNTVYKLAGKPMRK